MKYVVEFYYKGPKDARPDDACQAGQITFESGEFTPIPAVGDVLYCRLRADGTSGYFKVLYRTFLYTDDNDEKSNKMILCVVSIVVTDVSSEEMRARIKS